MLVKLTIKHEYENTRWMDDNDEDLYEEIGDDEEEEDENRASVTTTPKHDHLSMPTLEDEKNRASVNTILSPETSITITKELVENPGNYNLKGALRPLAQKRLSLFHLLRTSNVEKIGICAHP